MTRNYKRKSLPERHTKPPTNAWAQAVSRLSDEKEQGYDSLSLLLLLFETVFDVRANEDDEPEPWISYRHQMESPEAKTIESFTTKIDPKFARAEPATAA